MKIKATEKEVNVNTVQTEYRKAKGKRRNSKKFMQELNSKLALEEENQKLVG